MGKKYNLDQSVVVETDGVDPDPYLTIKKRTDPYPAPTVKKKKPDQESDIRKTAGSNRIRIRNSVIKWFHRTYQINSNLTYVRNFIKIIKCVYDDHLR